MAITIAANLAKKLPIPGSQFSSQQASITITAEVSDLNQVVTEAQRLYALAEQAVDAQLAQLGRSQATQSMPAQPASIPAQPSRQPQLSPSAGSQPYRGGNGQRRGPAPVTDSQLRFLKRLIDQTQTSLPAILEHHQVGGLDQLSCKAAAELIDELKGRVAA